MRQEFQIGDPIFLSNMTVYPVIGEEAEVETTTLEQAFSSQRVRVLETGDVNSLDVDYDGGLDLLILQGEEIVGARQNRIFASSMLLSRGRERVPVYCAEQGRWSGDGQLRPSGYMAFPSVRSIISQGKPEAQRSVWKEISRKQTTLKVQSKTMAMTESFRQKRDELEYYRDFQPLPNQVGMLIFSNLRFLGLDIFANSKLFHAFLGKLLLSYGLDALEDRFNPGRGKLPSPEKIMGALENTPSKEEKVPGIGKVLVGIGRLLVVRKLLKEGLVLHASVFPK